MSNLFVIKKICINNKNKNKNEYINDKPLHINTTTQYEGDISKIAIVVLTRGYNSLIEYSKLIRRNKHIENCLSNKEIELIFFHEGNITEAHQKYIKENSKNLKMNFYSIKNESFLDEKNTIEFSEETKRFNLNYRHMCHFWFVDFWRYCENYDLIIRIDEDCFIEFDIIKMFNELNNKVSVYGYWDKDCDFVTRGLNDFTLKFLLNQNIKKEKKSPGGPYTNIIGLNLKKLRENKLLKSYIEEIDKSDNIYKYRWGDLPLWGEVMHYMYNKDEHIRNNEIKYYHQSHNFKVN